MPLILFFNGWGMDKEILSHIKLDLQCEIIIVNYPYNLEKIDFKQYNKIYVVGWSFGVSYAAEFLSKHKYLNSYSIAINGHTDIIGKYGISKNMFNYTLDTLSSENFKKFFLNMKAPLELLPANINIDNLREQLNVFSKRPNYSEIKFNKIFLGKNDKIIPFSKQIKFFNTLDNVVITDCDHYPFNILNTWRKIISESNEF